jgi:cathepsin B
MLEDRFCIKSEGQIDVVLSPEDMVTCDYNNAGCDGGLLTSTINFLITEGVVTNECKPYVSGVGVNGFCEFSCSDPTVEYVKYACKHHSAKVLTSHEAIMTELINNGPVQVGFLVYDDFYYYSGYGGPYEVTESSVLLGGHAVKLIGWDHDANGRLYWICQNQWSIYWGDSGYFNIYANQCGIDSMGSACEPDITVA